MDTKIDEFINLLLSPDDGSSLQLSKDQNAIISEKNKHSYELHNKIVNLLALKKIEIKTSQLHEDFGSEFNYVDHYIHDAKFFDYFQEYEDAATNHENRRLHEAILSQIPKDINSILDVGCGNAWIAKSMKDKKLKLVSLDVSMKNVKTALEKYPFEKHYGLVADLYAMPIKAKSFDCIVCAEVIEHVADPSLLLQKLIFCLKPKGVLILTTPNNETLIYHMCVHCNKPTPQNAHIHSFTKSKLLSIASKYSKEINSYSAFSFSNKYLSRLRTHIFLQYLPFTIWKMIDSLANKLVKKPVRLLLKIEKK